MQAQIVQHYQVAPAAVSATAIHAAVTLADGEETEVTDEITNPDVPRVLAVKGNAAGITGDVVIEGRITSYNVCYTKLLRDLKRVRGGVRPQDLERVAAAARGALQGALEGLMVPAAEPSYNFV